jgi:hypothetical protein
VSREGGEVSRDMSDKGAVRQKGDTCVGNHPDDGDGESTIEGNEMVEDWYPRGE